MGLLYEDQRQYIWAQGWRPFKMIEGDKIVHGWRNKKRNRECQDIEDAYCITRLHIEVTKLWN